MDHVIAEFLADRARVGIVAVGGRPLGGPADNFKRVLEERFGSLHIPGLAQPAVDQIPVAIKSSVQVAPATSDLDVGLVHVPAGTSGAASTTPQNTGKQRGEARLPQPNDLVCELKTAIQEHLGKVAEAELVPQAPTDNEQHHVRGELQEVEGRAGALVELPAPDPAPELLVAERRS